ncbi:WAT1-related protein [Carex littledalei]|uniref:WAT1-related protein n=1 Tax=Carex littledalei TaxID=544730 RepID=A0A833QHG8_9POAL|nr:WAT1-related protein [Carex littledalei]
MGYCFRDWKIVLVMISVVTCFAVMNLLIKMAISEGMHQLVLVTLRQFVATIFIAPIAYFRERKMRPKMTSEIFVYLFFGALFGASLTQYLFFTGLKYTSTTFACAFLNIVPVFTFLMALPFRLDILNVNSKAGVLKLLGTLICLMGTILLIFYQGATLIPSHYSPHSAISKQEGGPTIVPTRHDWMIGSVFLVIGCIAYSSWFLVQSKISKKYPALYSGTAVTFFLSFIQAAAFCLVTEKGISAWIPQTKLQIITVVFSGIVGSGIGFVAMSWCVEKRGPVFTSAFSPLIQMMVAVFDISFLHEELRLGSVLGSALVIAGLYFLLWGKSYEAHHSDVKPIEKPISQNGEIHLQIQTV